MKYFLSFVFLLASLLSAYAQTATEGDVALSPSGSMPGKATYSASIQALASYATPTDIVCIFGSATKTVRLLDSLFYVQSTVGTGQVLYFVRRTAANTGGAPTPLAGIKLDQQSPASTASVVSYGSTPTLGAGNNISLSFFVSALLNASPAGPRTSSFFPAGNLGNFFNSIVLRSVNDGFCWNYNGAALGAGWVLNFDISWTEE